MSEHHETSGWGTQSGTGKDSEYDRRRFYVQSTNRHNHSASVRIFSRKVAQDAGLPEIINIPLEMAAEVSNVVADPRNPYRSIQDLARDALYHRLHDLAEMSHNHDFLAWFDEETWKQAIVQEQKENQAWIETYEFYRAMVEDYADDRNPHGIADVIAKWRERRPPLRMVKKWMQATAEWERIRERVEADGG